MLQSSAAAGRDTSQASWEPTVIFGYVFRNKASCEIKNILVTRMPGYTIISTSAERKHRTGISRLKMDRKTFLEFANYMQRFKHCPLDQSLHLLQK